MAKRKKKPVPEEARGDHKVIMKRAVRTASGRKSSRKRYSFMELPEEVQDHVINMLDEGLWSYKDAETFIEKETGVRISQMAISRYYNALYYERKALDTTQNLVSMMDRLKDMDVDEAMRTFMLLLLSITVQGLYKGDVAIRDIDVNKILTSVPGALTKILTSNAQRSAEARYEQKDRKIAAVHPEIKERVLKEIYGIFDPKVVAEKKLEEKKETEDCS